MNAATGSKRVRIRPALVPRCQPVQARARQSVSLILGSAARMLEESGLEAFNTNALAERAGVRIRTVYRYFPNKLAVLIAVAERMTAEWDGWLEGFADLADPAIDWRVAWSAYIDRFMHGIRSTPGGTAIRRAMRALPELQVIDRHDNERLAEQLAAALARRGTRLPRRRLIVVSRMLIETAVTVLDAALEEPRPRARALVEELKHMQCAYLEGCMRGAGGSGS